MKNKDLTAFYNRVYKKGERRHYTSLLLSGDKVPPAKDAVLKEISWKEKTVLDAGCGTGELAFLIAKKDAARVIGVDYSKDAIEIARKQHALSNLAFEHIDIATIKGTFDIICSLGTLEHVDDPLVVLRQFKTMLNPSGSIIVTCPNWTNPRGYMLLMLKYLFDARITLADIHYFTPIEFQQFAKKLGMRLTWKTVEQEWGHGGKMIKDFERRLPNVLKELPTKIDPQKIKAFIAWLETHAIPLEKNAPHSGAVGLYHLKK